MRGLLRRLAQRATQLVLGENDPWEPNIAPGECAICERVEGYAEPGRVLAVARSTGEVRYAIEELRLVRYWLTIRYPDGACQSADESHAWQLLGAYQNSLPKITAEEAAAMLLREAA